MEDQPEYTGDNTDDVKPENPAHDMDIDGEKTPEEIAAAAAEKTRRAKVEKLTLELATTQNEARKHRCTIMKECNKEFERLLEQAATEAEAAAAEKERKEQEAAAAAQKERKKQEAAATEKKRKEQEAAAAHKKTKEQEAAAAAEKKTKEQEAAAATQKKTKEQEAAAVAEKEGKEQRQPPQRRRGRNRKQPPS